MVIVVFSCSTIVARSRLVWVFLRAVHRNRSRCRWDHEQFSVSVGLQRTLIYHLYFAILTSQTTYIIFCQAPGPVLCNTTQLRRLCFVFQLLASLVARRMNACTAKFCRSTKAKMRPNGCGRMDVMASTTSPSFGQVVVTGGQLY